jgi:hypothetical protein
MPASSEMVGCYVCGPASRWYGMARETKLQWWQRRWGVCLSCAERWLFALGAVSTPFGSVNCLGVCSRIRGQSSLKWIPAKSEHLHQQSASTQHQAPKVLRQRRAALCPSTQYHGLPDDDKRAILPEILVSIAARSGTCKMLNFVAQVIKDASVTSFWVSKSRLILQILMLISHRIRFSGTRGWPQRFCAICQQFQLPQRFPDPERKYGL